MNDPKKGKKTMGKNPTEPSVKKSGRLKVPMTRLAVSETKQTLIKETIERITGKVTTVY